MQDAQIVLAEAASGDAQIFTLGNVVATEVLQIRKGGNVQIRGRTVELHVKVEAATPTFIISLNQAGELAELRLLP
jgi:hypothetical protein